MTVMLELARDLRAEGQELRQFVLSLSPAAWQIPTPFKAWTVRDVLVHLIVGDWFNVLSLTDPDRFQAVMAARRAASAGGKSRSSGVETLESPIGDGLDLVAQWSDGLARLCDLFKAADPRARMKWVGPDMSIRSAATARLMETWAHGQDIYDMQRVARTYHDRIRHIAVLGVNTYGWTFQNRGLAPPGPAPRVELISPSGAIWRWNAAESENRITGRAVDFCHVVTQGRNIGEVGLEVIGPTAQAWMEVAQCFAGAPEDPPRIGARTWQSQDAENLNLG